MWNQGTTNSPKFRNTEQKNGESTACTQLSNGSYTHSSFPPRANSSWGQMGLWNGWKRFISPRFSPTRAIFFKRNKSIIYLILCLTLKAINGGEGEIISGVTRVDITQFMVSRQLTFLTYFTIFCYRTVQVTEAISNKQTTKTKTEANLMTLTQLNRNSSISSDTRKRELTHNNTWLILYYFIIT